MAFNRISSNPKIYGGKPCIRGTRITVTMILDLLEDGLAFEEIIKNYYPHINVKDIQACLEYAKSVIDGEEVHFIKELAFA
ncbi:MAG TPA: DUF433 domain-containing protein [Anaerolineae bacterium]|nr:DUF433 domain-containing protein [Anaerolineae bacterium]